MNIVLKQEIFDRITEVCLETFSAGEMCRAEEMLMKLMDIQGVPMHYPYHHYIMPAALLTLAAIERQSSREELSAQLCEADFCQHIFRGFTYGQGKLAMGQRSRRKVSAPDRFLPRTEML